MKRTGIIITIIIAAFFLGKSLAQPKPCGAVCGAQISTVEAIEFYEKSQQGDVVILDVRTPEEFAEGHMQNAVNLDFNNTAQFNASLNSLDKTNTYLVYCRSGNRSGQALQTMEATGFQNVINLDGGIQSWQKQNLPLER